MTIEPKSSGIAVRIAGLASVLFVGFGLIFLLSSSLEANREKIPESYEDSDVSLEGKRLKGFALGYEGVLADWYWMRSLQYVGDKFAKSDVTTINIDDLSGFNMRLLYPYLDNATDLDPQFTAAYTYGSMVLPAIDPGQAIELINKGIEKNPTQWRLYQYLGYIYWRLGDHEKAAEAYEKGSQIPGSAHFMKMMVAAMKTQGGSRDTARALYRQMYEEAQDQQTKGNAEFRLMELDALDQLDAVRNVLGSESERLGRCPASLKEIMPLLSRIELPGGGDFGVDQSGSLVDPSGVPYIFDREKCSVRVDKMNSKIPSE